MIFLVFALKIEADPFIRELDLKKIHEINKIRIYKKDKIAAVVTGTGLVNTSSNLTYALSKFYEGKEDIILNIGTAGGPKNLDIGESILINKIIGIDKNEYFSDLPKHPFKEGKLLTVIKSDLKKNRYSGYLQDMEGEAVYLVAQNYVYQHNIILIKIISDYKNTSLLNKDVVEGIMDKSAGEIIDYIYYLKGESRTNDEKEIILTKEETFFLKKISGNLGLSAYQKNEFVKKSIDFKNRKNNLIKLLTKYKNINVSNKVDRGRYYDEIKSRLEIFKE